MQMEAAHKGSIRARRYHPPLLQILLTVFGDEKYPLLQLYSCSWAESGNGHQMLFLASKELGDLAENKLPGRRGELAIWGTLLSSGYTRPKGTVYILFYLSKPEGNALSNVKIH